MIVVMLIIDKKGGSTMLSTVGDVLIAAAVANYYRVIQRNRNN